MDADGIALWRDAAVTLLAIQAVLLGLLPAVALYWSLRRIPRLRQWVRPVLFQTRLRVWSVTYQLRRALYAVAGTFVSLQSAVAGLRRALQLLGWR